MEYLIGLLGGFLIAMAMDYKRKSNSHIKLFSTDWFIQMILLNSGMILFCIYIKLLK